MNVENQGNWGVSVDFIQKFLDMINFRMWIFPGHSPDSVHIEPAKICPVMTILDSINVDHRKDEKEVIFLDLIKFSIGHKIIYDALQYKRTLSLAWMLTGQQNDTFELIVLLSNVGGAESFFEDFGEAKSFWVLWLVNKISSCYKWLLELHERAGPKFSMRDHVSENGMVGNACTHLKLLHF